MSVNNYRLFYLAFCLAIAFMIWSLSYGALLGIIYKDPRILNLTLSSQPFAPILQLWYFASNVVLQRVALMAMVPTIAIVAVVAYVGLRQSSQPLGHAAFQTLADLRRAKWFRKDGHIFGRHGKNILRTKDDRHHLIIGPTRSGKGAGYVIPNALMHVGSMLVTDLKGEIYTATAAYRRKMGNQVYLFAPGQEETHRWNPMDFIRSDLGNRTTDIQNMASILVPKTSTGDGGFWQLMAQRVAAGLISYVDESEYYEGRRNLGELNSLLNSGEPLQILMKLIMENEPYLSKFTKESFNAYLALSEKVAASAITELQNALAPFQNERIVAATETTDIDLAMMSRKPISVYLAPNITDITILRPLLTLFVQQLMNLLTLEHNPNAVPVYFLLDEFRQLKKMDEIMTKLPYVAGYNIKLAFIIQDISNLDEIYGEKSRQSLLGNCGYQLILGANDQTTAEYVSRALGKQTIRYQSESRTVELVGLPRRTKVEQIRERDLMMPQEVRKMADKNFVLLIEGQSPIFGDKLRYFETEPFKTAEAYSKANRPAVGKISLPVHKPVPPLTDDYLNAGRKEEKTAAEVQQPPEPAEVAPVENVISATGRTSDIPPVVPVEAVPDDAFALKVLEPKRPMVTEPVTPDEELSLEEGITLKVLGAKKAIPVDLFDETIKDAENRTTSTKKKSSLKALKQVVLDLPETD